MCLAPVKSWNYVTRIRNMHVHFVDQKTDESLLNFKYIYINIYKSI